MKKIDTFKNRYTVRQYSDKPVSKKDIMEYLEAASHAPNTGNMQWYSVIATFSEEMKLRLAPSHFNQPSVTQAGCVLTFCVDLNRFEHWCHISDATPGYNNLQSFLAALIDTVIFAQQFCTIAEMNGLGTCYLGTTAYNADEIATVLELPDRVVPVIAVTVGYPLIEGAPSNRLPIDSIVHFERYKTPSDEDIKEAYSVFDDDPVCKRYITDNDKKTLAQVFTDVRYPRESAEYFSKAYHNFVINRGFRAPTE